MCGMTFYHHDTRSLFLVQYFIITDALYKTMQLVNLNVNKKI